MRTFPVPARVRGVSYFHGGRVRPLERGTDVIRALVQGTQLYSVELTRSTRRWKLTCTCTAGAGGTLCRHGYAFLSEVQQRGGAKDLEVHAEATDRDPALVVQASNSQRPSTEGWLEILGDLRFDKPPSNSRTQLLYLLTPGEPRTGAVDVEVLVAKRRSTWRAQEFQAMWTPPQISELDLLDRRAMSLIYGGQSLHDAPRGPRPFGRELQQILLGELIHEGRLGYSVPRKRGMSTLTLDQGEAWSFEVSLERIDTTLELDGWLTRGAERIDMANVALVLQSDFAVARDQLMRVDWHGAFELASVLVGVSPASVPIDSAARIIALFGRCPTSLPVHADEFVEVVRGPAAAVLEVLNEQPTRGQIAVAIRFDYGEKRIDRDTESLEQSALRLVRIERDTLGERAALRDFQGAGGELYDMPRRGVDGVVKVAGLGKLMRDLRALGWRVEARGKQVATEAVTRGRLSSGTDWFDLSVQMDFDGATADEGALLDALEEDSRLVQLSDGSLGLLPEDFDEQWGLSLRAGKREKDGVRFSPGMGFLLDALLGDQPHLTTDERFERWRTDLSNARHRGSVQEPAAFVGELRAYQREGLAWLDFLAAAGLGGCLADDMGLGKTVQVLAFALERKPEAKGPTLVVAPKTLLFNWESECQRFTPDLRVLIHHGNTRAKDPGAFKDFDIVVTTYGTLRLDIELLSQIEFDITVLDEAQAIKNPSSQAAKASRLLKARLRLALTGTPVENRLGDLLSIFDYLNPGLVEGSRALRALGAEDDLGAARLAAKALQPFLLRRTKEEVLRDLPPKTEQTLLVELEGPQKREYAKLREHYRRSLLAKVDEVGLDGARMNVLEALLRMRQAACHIGLIDKERIDESCAKFETLYPLLEEVRAAGHKALIFSQFTSFLAILRTGLDERGVEYEYLDGKTRDRAARVERFQTDTSVGLFLVSLKAGGVGLNLTAADYVFLLDPWWNPAVERQAVDRAHRIGQTRAVTAYRMVARDTVEEKVLALQAKKRDLAEALFAGEGRALREMTREDLEWVLS